MIQKDPFLPSSPNPDTSVSTQEILEALFAPPNNHNYTQLPTCRFQGTARRETRTSKVLALGRTRSPLRRIKKCVTFLLLYRHQPLPLPKKSTVTYRFTTTLSFHKIPRKSTNSTPRSDQGFLSIQGTAQPTSAIPVVSTQDLQPFNLSNVSGIEAQLEQPTTPTMPGQNNALAQPHWATYHPRVQIIGIASAHSAGTRLPPVAVLLQQHGMFHAPPNMVHPQQHPKPFNGSNVNGFSALAPQSAAPAIPPVCSSTVVELVAQEPQQAQSATCPPLGAKDEID